MTIALTFSESGFDQLEALISRFVDLKTDDLLEQLGGLVESQSHDRIRNEKQTPEGDDWEAWSSGYAETRHSNQSLLMSGGDLDDSITFETGSNNVQVGSNLIYAASHQFGDATRGIPAREFLGVSPENNDEIISTLDAWLAELAGEA